MCTYMYPYVINYVIPLFWLHSTPGNHASNKREYNQPKDASRYVSTGFLGHLGY